MSDSRSEIVMLRPPDGGAGLELSSFVRPDHGPGSPAAMSTELGLRNVMFEVDGLQAALDQLAADGYGLVGGVGQYEQAWRMAYVRGPEGIIVALAERIGSSALGEPGRLLAAIGRSTPGWRAPRFTPRRSSCSCSTPAGGLTSCR